MCESLRGQAASVDLFVNGGVDVIDVWKPGCAGCSKEVSKHGA